MTVKKLKEPIELKFNNSPSELLEAECFENVCHDLSGFLTSTNRALQKISKRHNVKLSVDLLFDLAK